MVSCSAGRSKIFGCRQAAGNCSSGRWLWNPRGVHNFPDLAAQLFAPLDFRTGSASIGCMRTTLDDDVLQAAREIALAEKLHPSRF